MKTSVASVCVHPIRTHILTLLLLAGLFGCSSSSTKDDTAYVEPELRTGTIVEAEQPEPTASQQQAVAASVKVSHPYQYTVKKGDTLWDIAARFLRDPWYWPDVWHVNPQIENPHLIYPGDILTMSFVDGRPRISMQRGSTVRLSPSIRSTPMDQAIPAIPVDAIRQFLTRPIVLDANTLDSAPYVVSFGEDHVVGGTDHLAYVRSIESQQDTRFEVVRPAEPLKDADTNEILGYNAQFVGNAELRRTGDPATVMLTSMELETLIGDRLLVVPDDISLTTFYPKAPDREIKGSIIKVLNGVSNIGQYDVVILDKTHDELAAYFGVTRPSLSRVISELNDEGVLEAKGKQIRIIDRRSLSELLK